MNFHFEKLIIWLKNGKIRTLNFLPNKVNIITGDSNTGKTAILDIIDYCLFASSHKISESKINENVEWYGIKFFINDKSYTIARKVPLGDKVSLDYYFSSVGEVPSKAPLSNTRETTLKKLLGTEFNIDQDTTIAYGGRHLRAGSRISLRYFLLFNTISQDIITHSEQFFDKQNNPRYSEALPRTFDLATGVDTLKNILAREKRQELEKKLNRLNKETKNQKEERRLFYSQSAEILKKAKEFGVIREEGTIDCLRQIVSTREAKIELDIPSKYDELSSNINQISRKIRSLIRFQNEYNKYKKTLKKTSDSLKPISFLAEQYSDLIKTSYYYDIVNNLEKDQQKIKVAIATKTPLDSNTSELVKQLKIKKKKLEEEQLGLPADIQSFQSNKEKYIFIGEVKAKLDLYSKQESSSEGDKNSLIQEIQSEIDELIVNSIEEDRNLFINMLNETIQEYITETKIALENYGEYRSEFQYKTMRLRLRKPRSKSIENVGSSSNHMFLHLFLFLGLHDRIINNKVPHVPPFLIIDQFSRPYWGEAGEEKDKLNHSDIEKVKTALKLLDNFIQTIRNRGKTFQMIIFEHISEDYWRGMKNIHLVEVFKKGNALIPNE